MRNMVVGGALLVSALIAAEPADAQAPTVDASERDVSRSAALDVYRIGPEDMLHISVWKNEAMSRTVVVRPDGKISLPLLNDLQAAGRTPLEIRDSLIKRLAEYAPTPEVSVIVLEVRSFKVSVIGEVSRPGRYEVKSWTTVLDGLAMAGGFSQFASRPRIVVVRPAGKRMKRIPFNYNTVIADGGEQENFYLQPGDIIVVP